MRGLLRRYEFNAFVSQSPQVNPFEQRFSPAEQDRRDSNVQFINEALTKILLDCVRPTADPHVHSGSGLASTVERLANASCYEVERRTVDCLPTSLSSLCPASPHEWVRTCSSQESRPQHSESHGRRNHRQPRSYRRPCRTRPAGTCVLGLATGAAPSRQRRADC